MKKFIYLLLCSGMLVACSKQSDGTNAASATKSASEVHTTASAAEGKKQVAASTEVSAAKGGDNPEVFKQFDQDLAQIQKQLPLKITDALEFTSVERRGNKVYYSYTLKDSKMNSKLFNKAAAEQLFKNSCQQPNLKQLFEKGVEFVYTYHFQDKSEITMTLSAKNCQ